MKRWRKLLTRPSRFRSASARQWFTRIADQLLNRTTLLIADRPVRLTEIEFYYKGPGHVDPFAHADPMQSQTGLWYFHRSYGTYRGGTFKGLDLTFGDGESRGGILIRSIVTSDGLPINGPSLIVDHILSATGYPTVAAIDQVIAMRPAWNRKNPLRFIRSPDRGKEFIATARVGLSLRRAQHRPDWFRFLVRPYRFVSEPLTVTKGKAQMVIALHRKGRSTDDIFRITGCPSKAISNYIDEYRTGCTTGDPNEFAGKDLTPGDLCRLQGMADRIEGRTC